MTSARIRITMSVRSRISHATGITLILVPVPQWFDCFFVSITHQELSARSERAGVLGHKLDTTSNNQTLTTAAGWSQNQAALTLVCHRRVNNFNHLP